MDGEGSKDEPTIKRVCGKTPSEELKVKVTLDLDQNKISIQDNGVGYSKKQLVDKILSIGVAAKAGDSHIIEEFGDSAWYTAFQMAEVSFLFVYLYLI